MCFFLPKPIHEEVASENENPIVDKLVRLRFAGYNALLEKNFINKRNTIWYLYVSATQKTDLSAEEVFSLADAQQAYLQAALKAQLSGINSINPWF